MSSFTSLLVATPMPDGRKWQLTRGFTYHVGSKHSRNKIIVPAGFITDYASVPRFLWSLIPPWGKYGKAAIIHDFLYQQRLCSRKFADTTFREAMQVLGVKSWRVFSMYWAVRMFGWMAWK